MPKLCIFDCDGTLVDSQHGIISAIQIAFRDSGRPAPTPHAVRHVIGLSLVDAMAALATDATEGEAERLADRYLSALPHVNAAAVAAGKGVEPLFPGVREGLSSLNADGWLLGVATGKSRRALDQTLNEHALTKTFVTLQTADIAAGKPSPDMVYRAILETGGTVESTVVVGDTIYDMAMAVQAGAVAIGVAWGYHTPVALQSAGAGEIVASFSELLVLLERWSSENQ
ncbi:MAG: HAD-IA family hydrolase [Rhodospirillales bacterium]|nr:HAD-IA family hydrolase [Rhodospirillales bacterium]